MKYECDYRWLHHKENFIAHVLLEIGKKLNQQSQDCFKLCTDFLMNTKESLKFWSRHFAEMHCHTGSPSRLSLIAVGELNRIIKFVEEKVKNVKSKDTKSKCPSVANKVSFWC